KRKEKRIEEEQAAKTQNWKLPVCYDDDDDEERSNSLKDNIIFELPPCAIITPNEPVDSLSMEDEHLDTIPAMESDEFKKSSVDNLIPIPSESEVIPDNMCDVPFHDNSSAFDVSKYQFEDFSDSNDEFSSTDDDSFSIDKIDYVEASPLDSELISSEVIGIVFLEIGGIKDDILLTIQDDILPEKLLNVNLLFKIEALNDNPTPFYDPIVSGTPLTLTPFGEIESGLMESLRTHDSSLIISSKIDSLLDEFAGELTLLKSIPSGIDETGCDFEEDIRLIEKLLHDNYSPCPPKEFVSSNSDTKIGSFSLSPIPVKDSDSLMKELDLSFTPDDPMLSGIKDDDHDSERDILILKDLPSNDTLSIPEIESFHFDIPLFSYPPVKPLDDEFAGELTLLKSIPPGIDETGCDFEEDIRLIEKLLYDNYSPCPPKEFFPANSDTKIGSFSLSPIPVKDSDSLMKELDLSFTPDDPMPSGIKDDDYDSERDILILKDFPSNDTLSIPEIESFYFDIPSFSYPPVKPLDGNTGILNIEMMGDISDQKAFMHKLMITLIPHQEKSLDLLSHRGLKAF
nr:hypothetical protein [Tanacetum cinerariifolium]